MATKKVTREEALAYHTGKRHGKTSVVPTKPCLTQRDLSLAYTPGVAEPCWEIERDPALAYEYTNKGNLVAVISNGTAVLGLGDIGALAGKPVMEGKGVLFKRFADIDVFDIEVDSHDPKEIIRFCQMIEPTLGGINLEDIKAPECFEIEETLKATMGIPVFHDDQHGTAIISGAALLNACEVVGKKLDEVKVVFCGAGASGIACAKFYLSLGRQAREPDHGRHQGRHLQGPHRRHEPVQGVLRPRDRRPHARRRDQGRRRVHRRVGQGDAHGGHGQDDGARTRSSSRWPTPTPRSRPRRCCRSAPTPSCAPAGPTTRTRSTTCSGSRSSSAARSTSARPRSTRR